MKIVVCGGRGYRNRNELFSRLDELHNKRGPITLLIHGACPTKRGADWLAEEWAVEHKVPFKRVEAHWHAHGHAAGPIRNTVMADMKPRVVVAFSGGRGTASMIRIAKERFIEVIDCRTSCPLTNKIRHPDRETARRKLEANRAQFNNGVDRRRENGAYDCPFCGGWHLSSHYRGTNTKGVDLRARQR